MRRLSTANWLSVWESGQQQSALTRALILLSAVWSDAEPDAPANLSIGRRDAYLLTLREMLFGNEFVSLAQCPRCAQQLELRFTTSDIRAPAEEIAPAELSIAAHGYVVWFRLPNSADLAALATTTPAAMKQALLARCLLHVEQHARKKAPELPAVLLAAIAEKMEQADPQANVMLALTCSDCGHQWSARFCVVSYLWRELDHWARHLLRAVHRLATAYGWREEDILALSAQRRNLYLEMIGRRL